MAADLGVETFRGFFERQRSIVAHALDEEDSAPVHDIEFSFMRTPRPVNYVDDGFTKR